ncbi:hypothetical protein AMECASPLE_000983 [Ameca splendens]|uniref:Uncharacterized protein n=1 Tax=Ameca splendens TaxID=208324 RepID=A0ABV0XLX8_9TELE
MTSCPVLTSRQHQAHLKSSWELEEFQDEPHPDLGGVVLTPILKGQNPITFRGVLALKKLILMVELPPQLCTWLFRGLLITHLLDSGEEKKPYNMMLPPPCLTVVMLHSPHSARPGQEHSWPDLVEPVDRRMERSPPRARFLRKHAQSCPNSSTSDEGQNSQKIGEQIMKHMWKISWRGLLFPSL